MLDSFGERARGATLGLRKEEGASHLLSLKKNRGYVETVGGVGGGTGRRKRMSG